MTGEVEIGTDESAAAATYGAVEENTTRTGGMTRSSRAAGRPAFWAAAGMLLLVMLALVPLIDNGNVAVPDDGVYASQVKLLSQGTWSMRRPAAAIDADGMNSAIGPELVFRDRQVPYPRHPMFTMVLVPFYRLGGIGGMAVFSVLGAWLASVSAGLLARRLDPCYGIPALAVMGIGSPLLFDAFLISAHAMAAALCGFVALGVAQVVDDRRRWPLIYLLICVTALVGLRSEATIVMALTAAVVGLMSVRIRPRLRIDRLAALTGIAIGVVTAVAYLGDAWWTRSIKDRDGGVPQPLIRGLTDRRDPLSATWVSLIRPWVADNRTAQAAIVIAVVAVILAAISIRVAPSRWLLPMTLTVFAAGCLVYQNVITPLLLTGLIGAFPLLVAGMILLRRADLHRPMVVRHIAIAVLSIAVITLTSYEVGGGVEWGGRFYHLLIPPLVPLVVLGLHHGYRTLPPRPAKVAATALVVGALALSGIIIQQHRWMRQITRTATTAAGSFALDHAGPADTDGRPLVIMGLMTSDGSARMFWDPSDSVDVVTAVGVADVFRLVTRAHEHGYPEVTLVTDIPLAGLQALGNRPLTDIGWRIDAVRPVQNTPFGLVRLAPTTGTG